MERRRALDGFLPDRVERAKTVLFPPRRDHRAARRGHGREGAGVDDDGVHAAVAHPAEGSRARAARRADHPRRSAHVRDGRTVLGVQDLLAARSAVRAGRCRPDAVVPRGRDRPAARGGDHRGRRDGVVHRGVDRVRDVGLSVDPVLHLLFDVRVPAGRRPDLGVRRPARQGLPARRHRGPHHAYRRRPAALRRPVAPQRHGRPQLPGLRPVVRLRGRRARARRDPAHVRRAQPKTASTTSRSTTRTTRSPRCPTGSRKGSCAACTATGQHPTRVRTARRSSRADR